MTNFYLKVIVDLAEIPNHSDVNVKISSLKNIINWFYYFGVCVQNLYKRRVGSNNRFWIDMFFKFNNDVEVKTEHLKFVRNLILNNEVLSNKFQQKIGINALEDNDVTIFHKFLNDEKAKITNQFFRKTFLDLHGNNRH